MSSDDLGRSFSEVSSGTLATFELAHAADEWALDTHHIAMYAETGVLVFAGRFPPAVFDILREMLENFMGTTLKHQSEAIDSQSVTADRA